MPGKLVEASVAELLVVSFELHFVFFFLARLWSQIAPFLSYSITNGVFVVGLRNENGKWELLVVFAAKTMKEWECNW